VDGSPVYISPGLRPIPEAELAKLPQMSALTALFSEIPLQPSFLWGLRDACGHIHVFFSDGTHVPISRCCNCYVEVIFRRDEPPILRCNNRACQRWITGPVLRRIGSRKTIRKLQSVACLHQRTDQLEEISKILDELF
jgi:hypothetical protein